MAKIDLRVEKQLRNKAYSEKFKKEKVTDLDLKRKGGKYASWCRISGHPASCDCVY